MLKPLLLAFVCTASLLLLVSCSEPASSSASTTVADLETPESKNQSGLTRAEKKYVCMVNNQLFTKEQIEITVEGRTYYGCCEMCKGRLANDPTARSAIDPVSGATVDKAEAVIGITPDGSALYFENEKTMHRYRS